MENFIFDSQFNTTNLTNSLVINRQSTDNDIGKLVVSKDVKFNDQLYVELDENTLQLLEFINELNWSEVLLNA